jgi:hypothetical protein
MIHGEVLALNYCFWKEKKTSEAAGTHANRANKGT